MMIVFCLLGILAGLFLIVAALRNSDWIRAFAELDLVDRVLGETSARIACGAFGGVIIVVAVLFWLGVI